MKRLQLERVDKAEELRVFEMKRDLQRRHEIELKRLETEKLASAVHVSVKFEAGNKAISTEGRACHKSLEWEGLLVSCDWVIILQSHVINGLTETCT